jgi:hydroxyacylglutathione hydrolase
MVVDVEVDEVAMDMPFDTNMVIVDVRKETEYANEHIKEAINIPLSDLTDPGSMTNLDDHHNIYIHCAGGYRSVIAASLIKREGIHNIRNIVGGWGVIKTMPDKFEFEKDTVALS